MLASWTWRTQPKELWTTVEGHTFAGSGNDRRCHGVAILLHKRWSRHIFELQAISARLATMT
eukprot:5640090-Pyramimonas_sp.AAC.1